MTTLARRLRLTDYFVLAFGAMIGVGWLVVMDDWLGRGGPVGAILGFALGGLLLLPVGYVYGEWVQRLPDAAGEAAYAAQVFPQGVSFLTGWVMLLAYFIVCPWEAVAVGKLAAYVFPALDSVEVYRINGHPVFLWRLVLGIALTLFLTILNYRGIRASATFQRVAAFAVLLLFAVVLAFSAKQGSFSNFHPAFSQAPLVSILLTLQIVPYFMTGFESVPKVAEEASPDFRAHGFFRAVALAVLVGTAFYVFAVGAVAYIHPWQALIGKRFPTAFAFEEAMHTRWLVRMILVMAMFALFECFNGNFVAASRLFFAFGRRGSIPKTFGKIHEKFLTPRNGVLAVAAGTLAGLFLGDALLVPVTEVGSMASAFGWLIACLSFFLIEKRARSRAIAAMGILVALVFLLMKLIPLFPGHFSLSEWLALAIWLLLGFSLHFNR